MWFLVFYWKVSTICVSNVNSRSFVATMLHPVFFTSGATRHVEIEESGQTTNKPPVIRSINIRNYLHVPAWKGVAGYGQPKFQVRLCLWSACHWTRKTLTMVLTQAIFPSTATWALLNLFPSRLSHGCNGRACIYRGWHDWIPCRSALELRPDPPNSCVQTPQTFLM